MPPNIDELRAKIRESYGCDSQHVGSEQVHASFGGRIAWQGTVEVFDLIDHPKAKRAYAWIYEDHDQNKTVTVLHVPPVDSPQSAVKVAIAATARQK